MFATLKFLFTDPDSRPWAYGITGLIALAGTLYYAQPDWLISRMPILERAQNLSMSDTKLVTFDPLWLANSEHYLAAQAMGLGSTPEEMSGPEATAAMVRNSKQVKAAIRAVAGPDTIVLVRQAMVLPDPRMRDITEAVLRKLDMPVNVPHEPANVYDGSASTKVSQNELERGDQAAAQVQSALRERSQDEGDRKHSNLVP